MTAFTKFNQQGKPARANAKNHALVLDSRTQLMWTAHDVAAGNDALFTFKTAGDAVDAMNQGAFGGFNDWRVPTLHELFTLADHTRTDPAINTDAFPTCKGGWYWTSTPLASSPSDYAWLVYFDYGNANYDHQSYSGRVRAVRSVSPASSGQ